MREGAKRRVRELLKRAEGLKIFAAVLPLGLALMLSDMLGVTVCPFRRVLGLSCAGCGMSRAWRAALCGKLELAYYFHPLFWLPVPLLFLFLLRARIPVRVRALLWGAAVFALLAVYAVRLGDPAQRIVVFEPEEGMVFRVFQGLTGVLGGLREFLLRGFG